MWLERDRSRTVAMTYDYTDETGVLLYQVVRTDPKGFYQRRPNGQGGWVNKKSKRQVLYRLREVLEAAIVFVVEGKKDSGVAPGSRLCGRLQTRVVPTRRGCPASRMRSAAAKLF